MMLWFHLSIEHELNKIMVRVHEVYNKIPHLYTKLKFTCTEKSAFLGI